MTMNVRNDERVLGDRPRARAKNRGVEVKRLYLDDRMKADAWQVSQNGEIVTTTDYATARRIMLGQLSVDEIEA